MPKAQKITLTEIMAEMELRCNRSDFTVLAVK